MNDIKFLAIGQNTMLPSRIAETVLECEQALALGFAVVRATEHLYE